LSQGNAPDSLSYSVTAAKFGIPQGLNWDLSGNILVADSTYGQIRNINVAARTITKIAGIAANSAVYGDGAAATSGGLNAPQNAIVDGSGNIFISDNANCRIRKITGGIISTFAGTTCTSSSSPDGNLASSTALYNVHKIAIDAAYKYLYVPEYNANKIRRINLITTKVTTVAGTGSAGYNGDGQLATEAAIYNPSKVVLDSVGGFYIADFNNDVIRYVTWWPYRDVRWCKWKY